MSAEAVAVESLGLNGLIRLFRSEFPINLMAVSSLPELPLAPMRFLESSCCSWSLVDVSCGYCSLRSSVAASAAAFVVSLTSWESLASSVNPTAAEVLHTMWHLCFNLASSIGL